MCELYPNGRRGEAFLDSICAGPGLLGFLEGTWWITAGSLWGPYLLLQDHGTIPHIASKSPSRRFRYFDPPFGPAASVRGRQSERRHAGFFEKVLDCIH